MGENFDKITIFETGHSTAFAHEIGTMNGAVGGMMFQVMDGLPHGLHPQLAQGSHHHHHHHHPHMPAPITSSMNRSQRCGVCRGCQCKPCGQCTYCQDSPQFGGPGVKKQSCIERRCLRVLENRLQRDAPTFKARVGCNNCEDCRMPDCQICLVCLDKRFFENRYMTGAMCAKKRCNNATSIELPVAAPQHLHDFHQRQAQKRCYETGAPLPFDMKRPAVMYGAPMPLHAAQLMQHRHILMPAPPAHQFDMCMPLRIPPGAPMPPLSLPTQNPHAGSQNLLQTCAPINDLMKYSPSVSTIQTGQHLPPISSPMPPTPSPPTSGAVPQGGAKSDGSSSAPPPTTPTATNEPSPNAPPIHQISMSSEASPAPLSLSTQPMLLPMDAYGMLHPYVGHPNDFYTKYYMDEQNGDPFLPPSYAPEMKNAVVLQPL
ncbi:unnamed protein product, partial [Mesorhabditis belari]|uniref:CXXC-type domain-containing protein n=1 Tax=Mesorhabditis belari TaxID=2138241 RepID=A0AAF3E9N5_9BILA